ncbi:Pre-mRNA-splicing factor cef1 [Lachnellula suecica]|uniref:Pre-mRNA-splicing factor cef1 n=1 Tax=Lachnellula suecica TaxID=602035 RepID=A0A8T9C7N0_9HELO|nr:Pre-mRNA-splicing factor cef1 [Lachnellula suecica]
MAPTRQSLEDFLEPLAIDVSKIHNLAKSLSRTYTQLAKESKNQFLSTPISDSILRPERDSNGRYLAIDIGGSNLRVGFVELLGHVAQVGEANGDTNENGATEGSCVKKHLEKSWPIGEQLKNDKAEDLFKWIGTCIAEVVRDGIKTWGPETREELPLGVTFSFPMIQRTLSEATLMSMGKGFAITSNLDLGKLILEGYEAIRDPSLPRIQIAAIVNDSVATLVTFAYQLRSDPRRKAAMGLIVGTGCNATIPLAISKLHPSKRPAQVKVADDDEASQDMKITVNTEWTINGAAPPLHELNIITRWDKALDAQGEAPGFQPFEYMTSGRYLGELGRLILVNYFTNKLRIPLYTLPPKLLVRFGLTTSFLGNIGPHLSHIEPCILEQLQAELPPAEGPDAWHWSTETAEVITKISKAIQIRAAGLTAAAVIALLACADEIALSTSSKLANGHATKPMSEEPAVEELMVGYTGGCIVHFQDYLQDCQKFLDEIMDAEFGPSVTKVPRVLLTPCHDGGIIGAGILAGTVTGFGHDTTNTTATMPVVKGGVWTNIEDEILKASVSKYGLNQWARVSSLLARKTPKQCKARWSEWLDPGIRKIEWSKEEDEKLLHLAKLMPTQWRTIAPLVGRTATQCLERYQKLLDEAEQKEAGELGLGGPDGGETQAPSADDVRRLRPGEVDPDPESKPARPDTIDLDEDEKEMLSEARARLANTQGKKAKRKARERQLEESRRLAVLQKRRELKNAGINIKVVNRKKGQMDYNADIPFEKKAAAGFYDTEEEAGLNEKEREAFDPRKQQLANKRKGDHEEDPDRKKRKNEKEAPSASYTAAMKAGQMQKIREAEQSSKRRALVLPTPQVGEGELEEIVKMGMIGERANILARSSDNDATRGLVNTYSTINSGAPIRTPKAPAQEDHIANEIRNIRALTETQSSLLGGENTPLHEGAGSTGFDSVTPRRHQMETPNPMATPFRQSNGVGATPMGPPALPGATPMRTPRDSFALNANGEMQLVGATPRDVNLAEMSMKHKVKQGLASLPKPKETQWDLELPEEQQESMAVEELSEEDAELRDRRNQQIREAEEKIEFSRRTLVMQKGLPRASAIDIDAILKAASEISDPVVAAIEREAALLVANDALRYPITGAKIRGTPKVLDSFNDNALAQARLQIIQEVPKEVAEQGSELFKAAWTDANSSSLLPGLAGYGDDEVDEHQTLVDAFDSFQEGITTTATTGNKAEKKLALHLGGYQNRSKMLRGKIVEASEALTKATLSLDSFRTLQINEEAAISRRLEGLREEVGFVSKREREAQDLYRARKEELTSLMEVNGTNGYH